MESTVIVAPVQTPAAATGPARPLSAALSARGPTRPPSAPVARGTVKVADAMRLLTCLRGGGSLVKASVFATPRLALDMDELEEEQSVAPTEAMSTATSMGPTASISGRRKLSGRGSTLLLSVAERRRASGDSQRRRGSDAPRFSHSSLLGLLAPGATQAIEDVADGSEEPRQLEPEEPPPAVVAKRVVRTPFEIFVDILHGAKQTESEGTQFVYVRRLPGGGPYDYELVPFSSVDHVNYMTVSPHGFTEYTNGKPSAFVPIEDWLSERQRYSTVREFRFFKKFPKWRAFQLWKDAGSVGRMAKASRALEDRLPQLHPLFQPLLLHVRELCVQVAQLRLIRGHAGQPQGVESFRKVQQEWQQEVAVRVAKLAERMHKEVQKTCAVVLDGVRRETRGPGLALVAWGQQRRRGQSASAGPLGPQSPGRGGPAPPLTRSGLQAKADREALETLGFPKDIGFGPRSVLRKECLRFMRFARLADLLLASALSEMALESLGDVVRVLSNPSPLAGRPSMQDERKVGRSLTQDDRKVVKTLTMGSDMGKVGTGRRELRKGGTATSAARGADAAGEGAGPPATGLVFQVEAHMMEEVRNRRQARVALHATKKSGVELRPGVEELTEEVVKSIRDGCRAIFTFEWLVDDPAFKPYRAVLSPLTAGAARPPAVGEPEEQSPRSQFVDSILQDDAWKEQSKRLGVVLQAAFEDAGTQLATVEQHAARSKAATPVDVSIYLATGCDSDAIRTLGDILGGHQAHMVELEDLPAMLKLKSLEVDIAAIKAQLMAGPAFCIHQLHALLPDMVTRECSELSEWLAKENRRNTDVSATQPLASFVQHLRDLERLGLEAILRIQQLERIRDLVELIDFHSIQGSSRKQAANIARDFSDFRQALAAQELDAAHVKEKFVGDLVAMQRGAVEGVEAIAEEFRVEDVANFVVGANAALAALAATAGLEDPVASMENWDLPVGHQRSDVVLEDEGPSVAEQAASARSQAGVKAENLEGLLLRLQEIQEQWDTYNGYEDVFGLDRSPPPGIEPLRVQLTAARELLAPILQPPPGAGDAGESPPLPLPEAQEADLPTMLDDDDDGVGVAGEEDGDGDGDVSGHGMGSDRGAVEDEHPD